LNVVKYIVNMFFHHDKFVLRIRLYKNYSALIWFQNVLPCYLVGHILVTKLVSGFTIMRTVNNLERKSFKEYFKVD